MKKQKISFLHTSDLHLGNPFSFLPPKQRAIFKRAQETVLVDIVHWCEQEEIQFLTIAGDFFDLLQPERILLDRVKDCLGSLTRTQVVICPGNHDPFMPNSIWQTLAELPHVFIFDRRTRYFDFVEQGVRIYGRAFTSHSATQPLLDHLDPAPDPSRINLLLLHGVLVTLGVSSDYNPIPREWLAYSGVDLALLGHVHQTSELQKAEPGQTSYLYSGCPMGRGFDELGSKGVWLGTVAKIQDPHTGDGKTDIQARFRACSGPVFHRLSFDLAQFDTSDPETLRQEIIATVEKRLERVPSYQPTLDCCQLILHGYRKAAVHQEMLKRALANHFLFLEIVDQSREQLNHELLIQEHSLRGEVSRIVDQLKRSADPLADFGEYPDLRGWDRQEALELIEQAYYDMFEAAEREIKLDED